VKKSDWPDLGLAHAAHRLGIPVADVEFLRACGVLSGESGIEEESLERFLAEAGTLPDGVAHAVLALRTEWDRALVERGPAVGRRAFGAVELGQHPDGTVVFAVEKALDRIVTRNLEVLGGGRVRQLIVDRSLIERWGKRPDLLEDVPGAVIERLPREMAWRLRVVPVEWTGKKLVLASARPLDFVELDDLRFMLGTEVDVVLLDEAALLRALERYYGAEPEPLSFAMAELSGAPEDLGRSRGAYMDFEEAKSELRVEEDELKKIVSQGELRGFRDGLSMKFKTDDVRNLKAGRETEPSVILTDSDVDGLHAGSDELILEGSTSDTVVSLGDVMQASTKDDAEPAPAKAKRSERVARPRPPTGPAPAPPAPLRTPEPPMPSARSAPPAERDRAITRRPTIAPPPPPMAIPQPMQQALLRSESAAPGFDPFGSGGGGWTPPAGAAVAAAPASGPVAFGAVPADPFAAKPATSAPSEDVFLADPLDVGSGEHEALENMGDDDTRALALSKRSAAPSGARLHAARSRGAPNAAPAAPKKDDEPETFERKATVRYYEQMYARHNYPLLVVVSKRSIQQIVKQHVAQVESKKSFKIRRGNPFVTVRPILPGCLSVPAEITLDVKPKVAEAKFWVTPTAEGVLEDARVEVVYEGKVVSTIAVPTRVTTQTIAKLTGGAAFFSTTAGPFFEAFGISVKKAGASFVADLLADMAGGSMRFGMAGVLAFLALVFFLRRRPKAGPETEGFFDWGVEEEVEGDPLVRAVKAKLVVHGPEGRDVVDVIHGVTLVGGSETAHVRVRGARSLSDVACELRYDDTFYVRARSPGVRVNGEDLREGEERKLGRDGVVTLDSDRVSLWLLDLRQDAALDARREEILEALVRARPSFERELRAIWKRTAGEPVRAALLEAVTSAFADPEGWRRVRESLRI